MTCSFDGSLRVWDMKSGKQIGDKWRDGESPVRTMALSPDGKKVVSGSRDGGVRLWDIDTGKVISKWMGHTQEVKSVCWSRDGQRVLSGSYDGTVREWDVENGETTLGPIEIGYRLVWAAVYSPDVTRFATAGYGSSSLSDSECPIKIWDAKTGELVTTLNGRTMFCLAWTMDGKTLISGSFRSDHSIRTWNTKTWKHVTVLKGHTETVYTIAISPNGCILASASEDNTARLWNLENGQPISSPLHHAEYVLSVSFSADGKQLATACDDKNAYLWDVSAILQGAGLEDLLLDKRDKSVRDTFIKQFSLHLNRYVLDNQCDTTSRSASQSLKPGTPRIFRWLTSSRSCSRTSLMSHPVLFLLTSISSAICARRQRYAISPVPMDSKSFLWRT
jgi:WD40 repeat protein